MRFSTNRRPVAGPRYRYDPVKRVLDVVVAGTALVVLSPVTAAVAVGVRIGLGRPVLFRQRRPGRDGQMFDLVKFRSMRPAPPGAREADLVATDAERLTRFGRWLRATSLDEIPSLWNVVRGDMSLVGPRPLLVSYLGRYSAEQARRHEVRPGITGLAQVRGRNQLNWDDRFRYDVWYVEHRSLGLDLRILARTIGAVLARRGLVVAGSPSVHEFGGTGAARVREWAAGQP